MYFASPAYLLLLLLLIPYAVWYILCHNTVHPALLVGTTEAYRRVRPTWRQRLVHAPFFLRCLCFAAAVAALARPQTVNNWKQTDVEGIDIMLCVDISSSMLAEDIKPNRVKAAREVAIEFVANRPNDNIGLTLFAAEAFTQCPLTADHSALINILHNLQCDLTQKGLVEDGTAIGMGLASSISRLKDSNAKSKVIILLTDGVNNRGDISPLTAADIAKNYGIRVYTVALGGNGMARYPVQVAGGTQYVQMKVEIDEKTLKSIAGATGGRAFRAKTANALEKIYQEIDQMERTKISSKKYTKHNEAYLPFALIALAALLFELLLRITILKRIP